MGFIPSLQFSAGGTRQATLARQARGLERTLSPRQSGLTAISLSTQEEVLTVYHHALERLCEKLELSPMDHSADWLGGSKDFVMGPSSGDVRGFSGPEVAWVSASEIRREGSDFVRTRIFAMTPQESCIPHLDVSIIATRDGTMMRVDVIPKLDLIEHKAYMRTFCGENRQVLWDKISSKATAMYVNPDAESRAMDSPCCISVICRNADKSAALVSQAVTTSVDLWISWIESSDDLEQVVGSEPNVARQRQLMRSLYDVEVRSATETFLDRDFAEAYSHALLGPAAQDVR